MIHCTQNNVRVLVGIVAVFVAVLIFPSVFGQEFSQTVLSHREAIVGDIDTLKPSGAPGPLCVFGPEAFPVVVGTLGKSQGVLIAAATPAKGRVVVFGHEGYLGDGSFTSHTGNKQILVQSVRWAAGNVPSTKTAIVGVVNNPKLVEMFKEEKINAIPLTSPKYDGDVDVLVMNGFNFTANDVPKMEQFVKNGGGLVTGSLGWGWLYHRQDQSLRDDFVGNQVMRPFGIAWADGTLGTQRDGFYDVTKTPDVYTHVQFSLKKLQQIESVPDGKPTPQEISQLAVTLQQAMKELPTTGPYRLPKLTTDEPLPVLTEKNPVRETDIRKRLQVTTAINSYKEAIRQLEKSANITEDEAICLKQLAANPSGYDFPGMNAMDGVKADLKPVKRSIDTTVPAWQSTGLYALPGSLIHVKVPTELVRTTGEKFRIRIGCHRDSLWGLDTWKRYPEITFTRTIGREDVLFANPFGGLVYIEVPNNLNVNLGVQEVAISGGVAAPTFVLGKTTPQQWEEQRKSPAPWGEFITDKVIVSVSSEFLRQIDDPREILTQYWDPALDAIADFVSRDHKRQRPERLVADRQISAGYMHSGYPIMTHLDVQKAMVDLPSARGNSWGFFHELGHNHQSGDWTFAGTGEVTVNFFSLYCYEKVLGIPIDQTRRDMYPANREKAFQEYVDGGKDYEKWKSFPFLALGMFVELQNEFGWEPFIEMIKEYRDLRPNERPRTDLEKRQQWVKRFSAAVGKDITPVFEKWGVPLTE